jgi:hypothetical protein
MEFCDRVQRPNLPFARHCRVSAGRLRPESQTFRTAAFPSSLFEEIVLSWQVIYPVVGSDKSTKVSRTSKVW